MVRNSFNLHARWPRLRYSAFIMLLLVFGIVASGCRAVPSSTTGEELCPSYCVGESFQDFYDANGGALVFGEPISGVLDWPQQDVFDSQYFESMRLDFYTATGEVDIADLGRWAFEGLSEDARAAMGTTHAVARPFAEYYAELGGEPILGRPLSPLLQDGAMRVQYFENGRLEWQPGLSTASGLYTGSIGRAHFDQTVYEFDVVAQPVAERLTQVNLSAIVSDPILYAGETQTFFITAESPSQIPADNLRIEVEIKQGDEAWTSTGTTGLDGRLNVALSPEDLAIVPGERLQATIRAFGFERNLLGETTVTFESWW